MLDQLQKGRGREKDGPMMKFNASVESVGRLFGTLGLTLAGVLGAEQGWREFESFRSSANPLQTDSSNPATFGFEITT